MEQVTFGGILKPFRFKSSIQEILQMLYPGRENEVTLLELIYKKKPVP
jgi:hypothetical protein